MLTSSYPLMISCLSLPLEMPVTRTLNDMVYSFFVRGGVLLDLVLDRISKGSVAGEFPSNISLLFIICGD